MTTVRRFAQVDVFTSTPYRGNPVAVVLDADGLDDAAMARFANWTNLSETTFVLPPTTPEADYRLRIFTPGAELPFAGHPTLGSAHAWLEAGGIPRGTDLVQECGAGLVTVRRTDAGLAFAAPPTTRSGPVEADVLEQVAAAFGIGADAIHSHQWVVNGPRWLAVELESAAAVLALRPDMAALGDLFVGAFGRAPETASERYEVRAFAPSDGVAEDPVTGSLNASIAQWLVREQRVPEHWTTRQGTVLGRAGDVVIDVDAAGRVWVGGASTTCITGDVRL